MRVKELNIENGIINFSQVLKNFKKKDKRNSEILTPSEKFTI
jgi:hypothetical protein